MPRDVIEALPNPPTEPQPVRFSLRTLFIVVTLVAIVFAGFASNPLAGILVYLACFTLVASFLRGRAACRRYDAIGASGRDPGSVAVVVIAAGAGVALAAAIAFCGTCTIAQLPFVGLLVPADETGESGKMFARGLFASIPLGTFAAIFVYVLTWPRTFRQIPPR